MKWQGFCIPIIILSLLVGLALFFGGQFLYQKYKIALPLEEMIRSNEAIQTFSIQKESDPVQVIIKLNSNDGSIAAVYQDLYRNISTILEPQSFVIKFEDHPDSELKSIWYQNQYIVHQAIMQGNYVEMAAEIKKTVQKSNVDVRVDIDHDNIYIQLAKDDGHTLFKIVARQNFMLTGRISAVGGDTVAKRN
ncbi:hypothetical protein M1N64_02295 [Peptococcaceae bacterium]|nr:hypothetical protein [Peptococcaceae bacterium]